MVVFKGIKTVLWQSKYTMSFLTLTEQQQWLHMRGSQQNLVEKKIEKMFRSIIRTYALLGLSQVCTLRRRFDLYFDLCGHSLITRTAVTRVNLFNLHSECKNKRLLENNGGHYLCHG